VAGSTSQLRLPALFADTRAFVPVSFIIISIVLWLSTALVTIGAVLPISTLVG